MANANEISIVLPVEVVESAVALAKEQNCTMSQLVREAIERYKAVDRLNAAIDSGEERSDALDSFLEDYVDRVIHEYRAERRAQTREHEAGERKAS